MPNPKHNIRFTQPEDWRIGGPLSTDEYRQDKIAEYVAEDHKKLQQLCEHYQVEAGLNQYYELALALARDFLPEPKKGKNKKKWDELTRGYLVVEFERLNPEGKLTQDEVASILAKQAPWKDFIYEKDGSFSGGDAAEALKKQYQKGKKDKWSAVMRDAFNYHEVNNDIEGWEELLLEEIQNEKGIL